jgi:hypothetical protein
MKRLACIGVVMMVVFGAFKLRLSFSQTYPVYKFDTVAHQKDVRQIGYVDSEPSLKMDIQEVGGKWYMYLAHYWPPHGWSVLDITDPKSPKIIKRIPLETTPNATDTTQIAVADGLMLTSLELYSVAGADPKAPFDEGVRIYDVKADPAHPRLLSQWKTHAKGTHRITYFGGRYAHVSASAPDCTGNIYVILDIGDPLKPVEAGRWHVPGQCKGDGEKAPEGTSLHGAMVDRETNIAYLSYQGAGFYMLDVKDPKNIKALGGLPFSPPFKAALGIHSAYPLPGLYDPFPLKNRKLALVNGESNGEGCDEPLNPAALVDITDMTKPVLISLFPLPSPPTGAPYKNLCEKWGRVGWHNSNDLFGNPFVRHTHNLVFMTWFNAGLRILDVADPRFPVEVGYFIPPNPSRKLSPIVPKTALVAQSQYALMDSRGFIYMSDWNQGIYVLQYTGPKKDLP